MARALQARKMAWNNKNISTLHARNDDSALCPHQPRAPTDHRRIQVAACAYAAGAVRSYLWGTL